MPFGGRGVNAALGLDPDAGLGLAAGGVEVAHLQADDFGKAQAGAESEAECEMVVGVGGGYGQEGSLLGAGQGLGGERRHGMMEPWEWARIKGIPYPPSGISVSRGTASALHEKPLVICSRTGPIGAKHPVTRL